MTDEDIRGWLDACEENRPDWWDRVKHLPTDSDKLDAIVMIGLEEISRLHPEMQFPVHLKN